MKKIFLLVLTLCLLLLSACGTKLPATTHSEPAEEDPAPAEIPLPDDFSFSFIWGIAGISSYDSKTGLLVRSSAEEEQDKYRKIVFLSEAEKKEVFRILFSDIHIGDYPDEYDPFNDPNAKTKMMSSPSQTIRITVTANGKTKTVACNEVLLSGKGSGWCDEANALLDAFDALETLLTGMPEWQSFPDTTLLFD